MAASRCGRARSLAPMIVMILSFSLAVLYVGCTTGGNGNDNVSNDNTANDNTANENSSNSNDNTSTNGDTGLTGKFIGSSRCGVCHNNIHSDWTATLHAHALETLENIGQGSNPDCIGCHTVGYGEPGGWVDRATTNDLAGVGCEACHGAQRDHAQNASDQTLWPTSDISASVCGRCHTDEHHPNYDDWQVSKHADTVEDSQATNWAAGGDSSNLVTCGVCHSGDYFYHKVILGEVIDSKGKPVDGDYLVGKTPEEMQPVTCAICHNPHARTGNAAAPDEGRDYQLRYEQVKYPEPSTDLEEVTDPTRFNLCGQCHHARERVWTDTSREPHPSDQVNVFIGEMPLPPSDPEPIVTSRPSVHLNAAEQCSTCHVFRKPIEEGIAPAVSGHTFEVNFEGCVECHQTVDIAQAKFNGLKLELDSRAGDVKDALDEWAADNNIDGKGELSWEYVSEGGPATDQQAHIPDEIKKARYIYYYVVAGGGNGVHNPGYVREALITALALAKGAPPALP